MRPDLGSFNWFRSVNNAGYLDRIADDIGPVLIGPCVVIGDSAGGAAAAYLATRLHTVQGIVFVDATDAVHSERWARARGVFGCTVEAMGHGDIEGVDRAIYRIMCGDASTAPIRALVQELVISSTRRFSKMPEPSDPWAAPAVHSW